MISITRIKKNIYTFNPELHWKIMIFLWFVCFLLSIVFCVFLYVQAKNQVGVEAVATSNETVKNISTEGIVDTFKKYKEKEVMYNDLLKNMQNQKKETVATTSLATTSKQ